MSSRVEIECGAAGRIVDVRLMRTRPAYANVTTWIYSLASYLRPQPWDSPRSGGPACGASEGRCKIGIGARLPWASSSSELLDSSPFNGFHTAGHNEPAGHLGTGLEHAHHSRPSCSRLLRMP